jgi:hypothetical protein
MDVPPHDLSNQLGARLQAADRRFPYLTTFLTLGVLFGLFYLPHIGQFGLYSDDWTHLRWALNPSPDILTHVPMDYRPFDLLDWLPIEHLFWPHLGMAYLLLILIEYVAACLLSVLVARYTGSRLLAAAAGLLWTVYPANMAQFWLTAEYYQLGACLMLAALVFLTTANLAKPARYSWALVCCVLCLCCNELFVGSTFLVAFVAVATSGRQHPAGRLQFALPFLLLAFLYLAYRLWLGPQILHFPAPHTARGDSLVRLFDGLRRTYIVLFVTAWLDTISLVGHGSTNVFTISTADERAFFSGSHVPAPDTVAAATILLIIYMAALLVALISWLRRSRHPARWMRIRPGVVALGIGMVQVAIGCVAFANSAAPQGASLEGINTRLNTDAALGAAVVVPGVIWILAFWLPFKPKPGLWLFAIASLAVGFLGCVQLIHTTRVYTSTWSEEQKMWRAVGRAVPGLSPDTFVILAGADGASTDVIATQQQWGISDAFWLLYPEHAMYAAPLLLQHVSALCPVGEQTLVGHPASSSGLFPDLQGIGSPANHILLLLYDRSDTGRVTVVSHALLFDGGRCLVARNPALPAYTSTTPPQYRWLVNGLGRILAR